MTKIVLPHKFKPRSYQSETFDAFFKKNYKRFIDIEHRRAGKDKKWLNIICAAAQQRVGTYLHALPKLNQARKVIWKGIDSTGMSFLSHIPVELIKRIDNTEMAVEFKNGSIYRLGGADNFDTWMGTNPVGIVFSEYALQDPSAWDYFRPIIIENDGWASFIYTPRGKNHGYELYETNKKNAKWFVQFLTVDDTRCCDGTPVLTEDLIEEERQAGMPDEMIQQEFYCSFSSAIMGAYYSKEMKLADDEHRITRIPIEPTLPVHTFWDLGVSDSTFVWFMQALNNECRFIHCYEIANAGMPEYVAYLHQFREKYRIVYGQHHAPHDIAVREVGTGKSRWDTALSLGLRFDITYPRPKNTLEVLEHIHVGRMTLHKCLFDEVECKRGIRCLKEYSKEWDDKNKVFRNSPKHDWTSHGADAFRTFAMAWQGNKIRGPGNVMLNRVNQGPL